MDIRLARNEDLDNIKDIWDYCFGDGESFVNYYFNNKYKPENTVIVEEDGEIISSLQLNQYKINLNNKVYDTSYVVGVSTYPQARGKGFMKNVMEFSLNEMYKRNQLVSILMPIDYRLYRKYGYEHCYDQIEYKLAVENLKDFKILGDFKKINDKHINYMIDIYNEFSKNLNGETNRDKDYYETLFKEVKCENGYMYIHEADGYEGYIIYFINGDTMFVREIAYKNIDSVKSMLKFIYNHNTQCKKITIMSPVNDSIRYILPNLKTNEVNIKPFMMGRIINLENYLKSLDVNSDNSERIVIKVVDNQIQANNGCFEINIKDKKVKVNKVEKEADITLSINYMSQLVFSYLTLDEVLFLKNVKVNSQTYDVLNKIFNKKDNYINEYV
ncbi:MAG: GNAT family N-acetyltransferase [Paraclostridium sp.]